MDWTEVNKNFGLCASDACPVHEGCLRWQGAQAMPEGKLQWLYASHHLTRQAAADGCPAFVTAAPQRMALGFSRALGRIPADRQLAARDALMRALGLQRSQYYEARNGSRPLNPAEQQTVAAVLAEYGCPGPVEFDAYEERIYWPV